MKTQDRPKAQLAQSSPNSDIKNTVIYTNIFEERKAKNNYKVALEQILKRAKKTDW